MDIIPQPNTAVITAGVLLVIGVAVVRGLRASAPMAVVAPTPHAQPVPREDRRERNAARLRNVLLFAVWAITLGVSAQGIVGFGRDNMGLTGLWPYAVFAALDLAGALCATIAYQRAENDIQAWLPRFGVYGIVAASSYFNALHAPDRPGAQLAAALMPVIAALLLELVLRETRVSKRRKERKPIVRRLDAVRLLHPVEYVRVWLVMATDETLNVTDATRKVRVSTAARRTHKLRTRHWWTWRPERRAQRALAAAGQDLLPDVLGEVALMVQARTYAQLDFANPASVPVALNAASVGRLVLAEGPSVEPQRDTTAQRPVSRPASRRPVPRPAPQPDVVPDPVAEADRIVRAADADIERNVQKLVDHLNLLIKQGKELPGRRNLAKEFSVPERQARTALDLVKQDGAS